MPLLVTSGKGWVESGKQRGAIEQLHHGEKDHATLAPVDKDFFEAVVLRQDRGNIPIVPAVVFLVVVAQPAVGRGFAGSGLLVDTRQQEFGGAVVAGGADLGHAIVDPYAAEIQAHGAHGVQRLVPAIGVHALGAPVGGGHAAAVGDQRPVADEQIRNGASAEHGREETRESLGGPDCALLGGGADKNLAALDLQLIVVLADRLRHPGKIEILGIEHLCVHHILLLVGHHPHTRQRQDGAQRLALDGKHIAGGQPDIPGQFANALAQDHFLGLREEFGNFKTAAGSHLIPSPCPFVQERVEERSARPRRGFLPPQDRQHREHIRPRRARLPAGTPKSRGPRR